MAFGGNRQAAFLARAAAHDEVDLGPALAAVLDLLKDGGQRVERLAKRAAEAVKSIDLARKATAELEAAQVQAANGIAAAKVEVAKLREAHDRHVAEAEKALAVREKAVKDSEAAAVADRKKAAELQAAWQRKLAAFEAA